MMASCSCYFHYLGQQWAKPKLPFAILIASVAGDSVTLNCIRTPISVERPKASCPSGLLASIRPRTVI